MRAVGVLFGIACLVAAGGQAKERFYLKIELQAHHGFRLALCTLVRTGEPFALVVTSGGLKAVVSGRLQNPKKQVFPLELDVEQGNNDRSIFERLVYELKLDEAVDRPTIVERCNHPMDYEPEITLTRSSCLSLKGSRLK